MADSDSKYKIITGDVYVKIGTKTKEEDFKSIEAFGLGERNNDKGDYLIEFAEEHKVIKANTLFRCQKIPHILELGVARQGNKKPNRFC